jgi:hypothetical protein
MAVIERKKRPALFFDTTGPCNRWDEPLSRTYDGTVTAAGR